VAEGYEVLVCGAGPAGLAAAQAAASQGVRVGLVDAQARPGGQVWRQDLRFGSVRAARRAIAAATGAVQWLGATQIVAAERGELLAERAGGAVRLRYERLVLATGARELILPFPGWTLPGVTGAGGLQALVKQGWPIAGRRVVVAGTGPLLLAVAAGLRKHGARLLTILEQAPAMRVRRFACSLAASPGTALQAMRLRFGSLGIPYRCGEFVVAAQGDARLQSVSIRTPRGLRQLECDQLAVGYGLVPNVELAELLGCRLDRSGPHAAVATDARLRTSISGVYAAGEVRGVGGAAAASIEGRIAGLAACGQEAAAARLAGLQQRARRFAARVARSFALDPRLRALASPETIVCRCEDVPLGALAGFDDGRAAKLATRCGMGACQGRLCGDILAALGRYPQPAAAAPLFPVRLSTLSEPMADSLTPTSTRGN
jgi:NADPH-dependent 2,4-dienoyl-CoA reductase/sulfur reductase-like enzyme